MSLSREQFIQRLEESSLMSTADIETFIDALPQDDKPQDGEQLARLLVQQKQLTAFQAQQIYAGKQQSLVLGNYTILDKLGQGGMGMVLKAEHRRMHRLVALKVLSPAATKTPGAVQRFHREVEAAAKLEHPNIVTAYDADESDGTHFLVMQYVAGKDLSVLVKKKGPLAVDKAVSCILQAARGLQYAHEQGVIHRDIKPANLLVDANGTVQILDMGLARLENSGGNADQAELTSTGQIMGTVDYMAPEQALNTKAADARSDIYSLGITLWYLLTGRAAYGGDTLTAKLLAHQQSPIPSLISACSGASAELDAVFQKMVAKQPADRQQTMAAVVADLERCLTPTASAPSITATSSEDSKFQAFLSNLGSDAPPTITTPDKTHATADVQPTIDHSPTVSYDSSAADTNPQMNVRMTATADSASKTARTSRLPINLRDRRLQIGTVAVVLLTITGLIWSLSNNTAETPPASGGRKPTDTDVATTVTHPPFAVAPFDEKQARAHQQAWAEFLEMPAEFTNDIGMKFRLIPPGMFDMGSTEAEVAQVLEMAKEYGEGWEQPFIQSEAPRHKVRITKPFYLGVYEVTHQEFQRVMTDQRPASRRAAGGMTFEEMVECCKRIGNLSGSDKVGRLPTEAEWEYACRAGTTTHFAFGDSLSAEQANFDGEFPFGDALKSDIHGKSAEVGMYHPNPFGLYDMHGNHWEMCSDWYAPDYYKESPLDNPTGPQFGEKHVERGADVQYSRGFTCRSAFRHAYKPPWGTTGFRVALTIESPKLKNISPPAIQESSPTESPTNHALAFNGTTTVVNTPIQYDGKTPLTVEAYIIRSPNVNTGSLTVIADAEKGGFAIEYKPGKDMLSFTVHDIQDYVHAGAPAPPPEKRTHLAGVIDGDSTRLYADGKLIATGSLNGVVKPSPFKIGIGANPHPEGPAGVFPGIIDEVRISKSVRYTENFTPQPRFEPDAETIALYHFDEGEGDIATDSSGNGYNGKIVDAEWVTSRGQPLTENTNHALEFNGISSVVSTPVKYDGKTPLTIETYILRDPEIPKTGQTIISDVELGGFSIWYSMNEDQLMLSVHDSKDYDHSAGPAPPAGQWVHVAGVIDGNTSRLYVDGKKILTGNLNGGVKPSPFKIVIGANPHPAGPVQVFAGIIDEVRISKSVRYTENFTPRPRFEPDAETIALYHFDEGDGDVAIDSSGNGHDAKITNANWVIANAQPIDNVDRKVAAQVLQVGGHLNLQILDEYDAARPLQVKQASELPTSPFVLRSIYLSNVKDIGNDQLFHLSKLRGLHELHLHNTNVTDIGLQHLRSITTLRNINLYGTQVNDAGLAHLAPLPQLVSISLSHTPAEQSGIAGLRSLHALRSILISNTISKERLIELASGNSIRELKFAGDAPQFTPAVVAEVHKTNPHCRIRALGGSVVGRDPVRELAEWVRQQGGRLTLDDVGNKRGRQEVTAGQSLPDEIFSIRSIDFSRNDKIVDADLSRLTASIYLHELKLTGTKITDDGVGRLADCPTLGSIWLDDTQITDQSLKLLHQHFRLSSFYLHGTKVSGDGVKLLVGEPQVRWLSIGDSSIGADALTHISRMPKLQSLSLWRSDIGDEDIKQLASLRRLEKLDLSDTRVTKQGAAKLSKTLPRCTITYGPSGDKQVIEPTAAIDPDRAATLHVLQSGGTVLITARDESFTNREIKREADLPHIPFILHTVYFTNVKDITNEHLKPLAELKSLTQIGLQHTDITDDGLAHLSSIDSLYNLNLSYSRMTEAGLKHLANLPSLTNLAIAKSPIETSGLTGLSSLPILRWLTVSRDVSKERFLELARIDGLRELEFVGESAVITPAVVKEFHKVNPHCRIGRYNKEVVGRDPVRELAQWVQQQQGTLRLLLRNAEGVKHELTADQSLPTDRFHIIAIRIQENDKITDADLQRITVPAFLYEARFDGTNISDDGLKYLGDCPTLATIGLNDTHVAGKSLSQLSRLARLERLGLRGAPLTNDTIRELVTLKHVTRLAIGNDQITGEALTHLARMKQLQRLALSKTNIADDDLPKLAPLKNLNHLSLSDSKVTPAGAERLKKLLPACNITFGVIDDADIPEPAGNNKSSSQPTSSP